MMDDEKHITLFNQLKDAEKFEYKCIIYFNNFYFICLHKAKG